MNDEIRANVFLLGASSGEEKGLFKSQDMKMWKIFLPEAMEMKNINQ